MAISLGLIMTISERAEIFNIFARMVDGRLSVTLGPGMSFTELSQEAYQLAALDFW